MSDVVVIGAGLAGLYAALRLRRAGAEVTLATKGIGGLQLGQGTIDVLGDLGPDRILRTFDTFHRLGADHPYTILGADAVRAGLAGLRELLGEELLVGDPDCNAFLPTAVGALRPTALYQPSMAAWTTTWQRAVVVGPRQLKDFQPELIAGNLARAPEPGGPNDVRAARIDLPARPGEPDATGLTYARALDGADYRARFAAAVADVAGDAELVLLPGVLGLRDPGAWRDLEDRVGRPVAEIPLPPPGVPGMRLNERLTAIAKAERVRVIMGSRVVGKKTDGARITSVQLAEAGRQRDLTARAFLFAPGGFESGALTVDSRFAVHEPALGLPVAEVGGEPTVADYWAEQPVFRSGVRIDAECRVVDAAGAPAYPNLRAAGGVVAGAVRWREKSGDGIALATAHVAVDSILKELA